VTVADIHDQPPPTPNAGTPVWELALRDMHERDQVGRQRYGTPLQTNNGRLMLVDAYQEVLDLAVYLRGEIAEREKLEDELSVYRAALAVLAEERWKVALYRASHLEDAIDNYLAACGVEVRK
jgi:hypothetical protein